MKFDPTDKDSIIRFAKELKNHSLREICEAEIEKHGYRGKGRFGQILEKFYFGYEPNSDAAPDFPEAGLELKASPLKKIKSGAYRSKERLILGIINYLKVHKESFEESSFWRKNAHLLLVFYLYERDTSFLDYIIKLVGDWQFPEEDLKVIKHDWELINKKIREGKAHELSEGDTFYLGAATKGATAKKSLREQPFSDEPAKQRAYSLKGGYVNHIIAKLGAKEKGKYGKIVKRPELISDEQPLETFIIRQWEPYYGKTPEQIAKKLNLTIYSQAKNQLAKLTKGILGVKLDERIEEFEKAEVEVKTIRVDENGRPKESISFPYFKYTELVKENWDESTLKERFERKFFFIFYQKIEGQLYLQKVRFWNMPASDLEAVREVWERMQGIILSGKIINRISGKRRFTHFPKSTEHRICHVRPHARDASDTVPLPLPEATTGAMEYTKHCFWLNARYVQEEIYLP